MLERVLQEEFKRVRDPSLDFREANTSWGVHGIFDYPAMMIFPIARKILLEYSKKGDMVLDPFVGSGTVAVESYLNERNSIGCDINPLGLLLGVVKTTPIPTATLNKELNRLIKAKNRKRVLYPYFFNLDFWYKSSIKQELAKLLTAINEIEDRNISRFFKVAFAEAARLCSNSRAKEFKLVRIKELENHNPDVFGTFERKALKNIQKLETTYWEKPKSKVKILKHDTRKPLPIEPGSIDLVLTSPPYGDSRTTVAYGQFSRLPLQWLELIESDLDKDSLGGRPVNFEIKDIGSRVFEEIYFRIAAEDSDRVKDVAYFYRDLKLCLKNIIDTVRKSGYLCFVVGNRTVKGINIPMDAILVEMMESLRVTHLKTLVRHIPTKRMPRENSPTNEIGKKQPTMSYEYVVILKK